MKELWSNSYSKNKPAFSFRQTWQQAWLHMWHYFQENFPEEPDVAGIRVCSYAIPPHLCCTGTTLWKQSPGGLVCGSNAFMAVTQMVQNTLFITLIFTQFKRNSIRKKWRRAFFPFPVLLRSLLYSMQEKKYGVVLNPKLQAADLCDWCLNYKWGTLFKGEVQLSPSVARYFSIYVANPI